MADADLSSYIPNGKSLGGTQMIGEIAAICAVILLLIFVTAFLISLFVKRQGKKKQEMVRNDDSYSSITDLEKEEFQKYCISSNESPLAVIGNRGLKQYLVKDDNVEGFSVVTNRRVYFKGSYLKKGEKGRLKACSEDCTVDNYEIKKVEIITERPLWPLLVAGGAALLEIAGIVFLVVNKILGNI